MRRNWDMIVPPYRRSHSHTRSSKASRPSSLPRQALLLQVLLDDALGRDAGVVVTGLEEAVESLHPLPADERVGERKLKRVAEVQLAGDVRGRERDDVRLSRVVRLGRVQALVLPRLLPARLDPRRAVERIHGGRV